VLQHYAWEPNSNARCVVYLHVLDMLSAAAQERYPYHIEKGNSCANHMCDYISETLTYFPLSVMFSVA